VATVRKIIGIFSFVDVSFAGTYLCGKSHDWAEKEFIVKY